MVFHLFNLIFLIFHYCILALLLQQRLGASVPQSTLSSPMGHVAKRVASGVGATAPPTGASQLPHRTGEGEELLLGRLEKASKFQAARKFIFIV